MAEVDITVVAEEEVEAEVEDAISPVKKTKRRNPLTNM